MRLQVFAPSGDEGPQRRHGVLQLEADNAPRAAVLGALPFGSLVTYLDKAAQFEGCEPVRRHGYVAGRGLDLATGVLTVMLADRDHTRQA